MAKVLKKFSVTRDKNAAGVLYHDGLKELVVRDDTNGKVIADLPMGSFHELNSDVGNLLIVNQEVTPPTDDYRIQRLFGLYSKVDPADFNQFGDITHIKWYVGNENGRLAIEEDRVYTRTEIVVNNLYVSQMTKQTTVKFYKNNGDFITVVYNKAYNQKEIKVRDTSSRKNLVEKTRDEAGLLLLGLMQQNSWTMTQLQTQIEAAKQTLFDLDKEINVYINHRESKHLIEGLKAKIALPTYVLDKTILNHIVTKLNIKYYPSEKLY